MKQYAALNDTVYFWFAGNDTYGSGDDGAAPAADVRLAGAAAGAAPVHSPVPVLLSDAGYPAGAYEVAIAATAGNGYAVDNTYAVFCTLAVDGQNPTGFIGSFDLKPVISNVTQILTAAPVTTIADAVWDDILTGATHNIATSAGRRLRELGSNFISGGTAQGGTISTIQLAAGELATNHIYNRNLVVILAGTGIGQTRTVVDYIGATKTVHVDRDWWITPDATSEYAIIPDDTPLVADHGIASAGTINTITIRTDASAISTTYSGSIIQIMAGTGEGQARLIDSYDGGTKIITICSTWTTTPDNTSVYVILPYGTTLVCNISPDPLADIRTQADDALTAINMDHLLQLTQSVNDGAPNAADFITDSAVAVDDWYNGMMLVFASGALAGLGQYVDNYDGATKRIYLTNAMAQAPANGDDFIIVPVSVSPSTAPTVAQIADGVWDEVKVGHTINGTFGGDISKLCNKLDRNFVQLLLREMI